MMGAEASAAPRLTGPRPPWMTLFALPQQDEGNRDRERQGRDRAVTLLTRCKPVHIMAALYQPT
jgi:hypothetical protein